MHHCYIITLDLDVINITIILVEMNHNLDKGEIGDTEVYRDSLCSLCYNRRLQ